jgi:nucleoside-diphosphate-sugar epimerase
VTQKLLITGSGGLVGGILRKTLSDTFELFGLDSRADMSSVSLFQADIRSPEQVEAVFARIPSLAYVVHLAGDARVDADWDSAFQVNIGGTENIYAAAHRHGIQRVVLASSNHVTGAYEGLPPVLHLKQNRQLITTRDPIRPDGFYGVSKAAAEAIARMYFELYGLPSVCLRIGTVLSHDDPTREARTASTWLSHRDLVQLVLRSLSANVRFGIYYGVSNNQGRFWDISDAERDLGYHPEDDASHYSASRKMN